RTFQLFNASNSRPTLDGPDKVFAQPSPILDFIWYPTASVMDPASYCFVASVRECPVKLFDASDGRLRASYRIVDHRERQIAPHSMAFNPTAERLYCGFEDAVEVFDVSRPGEGTRLPTTPSKKSKDGLKGLVSALAFVPSQGSDMYAAGSLSSTSSNIALFSETQGPEPVILAFVLIAAEIAFNPLHPHIMYAAYRRHGPIYSWDLRSNIEVPLRVFKPNHSAGRTNQKLKFDIDIGGSWLASGDQLGNVSLFTLNEADSPLDPMGDHSTAEICPTLEFAAHGDAVGSVAFHPLQPTLLSVSGSRHFESDNESESSGAEVEETEDMAPQPRVIRHKKLVPITLDASIKTWSFQGTVQVEHNN
ncbi:hypothetical protein H0H87_006145, partial [Tephrocybe sp. NHM501043]